MAKTHLRSQEMHSLTGRIQRDTYRPFYFKPYYSKSMYKLLWKSKEEKFIGPSTDKFPTIPHEVFFIRSLQKTGNYFLSLLCNSLYNVLPFSQPSFLFFPSFISILFCLFFPIITTLAKELVISLMDFFLFPLGSQHSTQGSQFPDQGWNSRPQQWKLRVLTTEPPWKFLIASRAA